MVAETTFWQIWTGVVKSSVLFQYNFTFETALVPVYFTKDSSLTTSEVLNVFAGTKIDPNLTSVNEDVVDWGVVKLIVWNGLYMLNPLIFAITSRIHNL